MKKAFEAVDRKILLQKLANIGVRGNAHKWFQSYFELRKQYVQVNDICSNKKEITTGITQGTELASTLFLIFIDNIKKLKLKGKLYKFADDMAITYKAHTETAIEYEMNEDFKKLEEWMDINKLTINIRKTKIIIIDPNPANIITVKYKGQQVEQVHSFKYLGVTVDQHLNWKDHIKITIKKASVMAGIFRKIKDVIPEKLKRSVFFSLFHSKISYGIAIWSSSFSTENLAKIQTIQNRAIKNLYKYPRLENTNKIHKEKKILKIIDYKKIMLATHINNIINDDIKTITKLQINNQIHHHFTRNHYQIHSNKIYTTRFGKYSSMNNAINIYNRIPHSIKNNNKKQFKKEIYEYFINQYNYI